VKQGSKQVVQTKSSGTWRKKAEHETKEKAQKQVNLLQGVEHGWKPTGKPAKSASKKSSGKKK